MASIKRSIKITDGIKNTMAYKEKIYKDKV
jgi:hypothetical protein